MGEFMITTENTSDLPISYLQENNIRCMSLTCTIDGEDYGVGNELSAHEFYGKMRNGSMPITSQVNPSEAKEIFEEILRQGKDVLHIAFSSGLSGSCNCARFAAEELAQEMPEGEIIIIDTLAASLGEGLLIHKAVELKKQGKNLGEIASWLEANKLHLVHVFTVDNLHHLHRGGRVSKVTAVVGSMINIKPILHVNDEGRLIPVGKVRGRKKSLAALIAMMEERIGAYREKNDTVFISHGDCEEDANYVAELVKSKFGIENVLINPMGSTIGAHVGPGTVALFFMGEKR